MDRGLSLVGAGLLLAASASCANVPEGGHAKVVRRVLADGPELPEVRAIRRLAEPPRPGATPGAIVRGFLTAQTSAQNGYAIARQYLLPQVTWNPAQRVVVYTSTRLAAPVVSGDRASVRATVERVGSISARGEFRPASPVTGGVTFHLRRVAGTGWRLADAPAGVLLNRDELSESFQRTTLYFPGHAHHLVPDPVFVQATDQPVVAVVRALLDGPPPWLAPAVPAGIPEGTQLLDSPVVTDGVVQLNFSRELRRAPQETLGALVAQLVWTLTDVPVEARAVRVSVEGEALSVPGRQGLRDHRRSDWADYAPVPATLDQRLFYVRDGVPLAIDPAGRQSTVAKVSSLAAFAVNRAGTVLAGVTRPSRGRQSLVFVDLTGRRPMRTALTADRITVPTWEPGGDVVWVAYATGEAQQVVTVSAAGGTPSAVGTSITAPISALRLSPDGARVALVVGAGRNAALVVGRVERPASGGRVLGESRPVAPAIGHVTAATFDGATQLTFASYVGGRTQLYRVDLDGYNLVQQRDEGLPAAPVLALAASPATPPDRIASADGRLWRRAPGADWAALGSRGSAATYAG